MANTVTLLNYANTFGDWIVTTNKLSQENNDLATNNYVKQAGTLFLNSPTLGLQVANNAVVQGQLQVSGIGSSTYLQTGLQVDGTARFTNTTISMSTSGIVYANGSANGVIVANNATVRGNVYAGLVYSGNAELQANDRLTLATAQSYTDTANSFLQANDRTTLTSAQSYTDTANTWLQANDRTTLTLAQSYTDTANSFLRANDRTTLTLAQNYTDTANSFLRANDRTTLTVSQNYTDSTNTWLQANDRSTLTLAQNYTDSLNSWTQSSISTGITTTRVTINSLFDANTATGYINQLSVGLGGLTVTGAFTISGATVYNTDTFTLNAGQTTGQNALFVNNRGSSGANAQIRWNEVQKYWDIRDVNNPTSYSQIVTANLISDSLTSTSSSTIASSRAANTIVSYFQGVSDTQNSAISAGNTFSRMAATTANTAITNVAAVNNFSWMASWTANSAWSSANAAIVLARAAYGEANAESDINITQNTWITNADILATAAYGKANAEGTINNTQNTWITNTNTKMEAAYATANINSGDIAAIESINITQNTNITNADSLARAAYGRANTSSNSFVGTTGTATPSTGSISFSSNNGITVYGSSNILNISTPQDLRSTASPTFAGLNLTTPLQLSQGGTSATSASGALTNLLPTGTTAGYVLTTGGPGNFYWSAAGGGGGGATPGTTINSTRLSYSGNSVVKIFTTPDFSQTTQLRAYINGVRQFESEYSVNVANSTIVFSTAPQTGDAILLEVDGYINNPYYANNIAFTAPQGGIVATANTIQLAINDLESRKATIDSPSFTGYPLAPTAGLAVSNTQIATTAYVNNKANSGVTFTHNITGSAGSVANSGIVGLITNAQLAGPVGATLTNDTTSATTRYITFTTQTSGTQTIANVSSTKLTFVPSTGTLSATVITSTSDEKLKENVVEISDALNTVMKLKGVEYNWKDTGEKGMGLIAQDVEKILPYLVSENENGKSVMYQNMVGLLIEAIKELKQEIDRLKGDNK